MPEVNNIVMYTQNFKMVALMLRSYQKKKKKSSHVVFLPEKKKKRIKLFI